MGLVTGKKGHAVGGVGIFGWSRVPGDRLRKLERVVSMLVIPSQKGL